MPSELGAYLNPELSVTGDEVWACKPVDNLERDGSTADPSKGLLPTLGLTGGCLVVSVSLHDGSRSTIDSNGKAKCEPHRIPGVSEQDTSLPAGEFHPCRSACKGSPECQNLAPRVVVGSSFARRMAVSASNCKTRVVLFHQFQAHFTLRF